MPYLVGACSRFVDVRGMTDYTGVVQQDPDLRGYSLMCSVGALRIRDSDVQ